MRFLHLCGFGLLFDGCLNVAYLLVQPTNMGFERTLDHRIGTTSVLKEAKRPLYSTANLVIGIKDNATFIVITQANWQGKPQFPLLCFVKLTALEAPAQKV